MPVPVASNRCFSLENHAGLRIVPGRRSRTMVLMNGQSHHPRRPMRCRRLAPLLLSSCPPCGAGRTARHWARLLPRARRACARAPRLAGAPRGARRGSGQLVAAAARTLRPRRRKPAWSWFVRGELLRDSPATVAAWPAPAPPLLPSPRPLGPPASEARTATRLAHRLLLRAGAPSVPATGVPNESTSRWPTHCDEQEQRELLARCWRRAGRHGHTRIRDRAARMIEV